MRVLVITDLWPHPAHSTRAANVVFFELLTALAALPGLEISCLRVFRDKIEAPSAAEEAGIAALREAGVTIAAPLVIPPAPPRRAAALRALAPAEIDYIPEAAHRDLLAPAVAATGAEAVLIPWSEWLTAFCATVELPKFAYYGNPPPKNRAAADGIARRNGAGRWTMLRQQIYDRSFESVHLTQMKRYDWLGDVAANDAEYYLRHGHGNAFYIRNMWIDRIGAAPPAAGGDGRSGPAIIIGNVGRLSATANSLGLEILASKLLPELRQVMPPGSFEIHLIGAGKPLPWLAAMLDQKEIRIRGFVDDIDHEIMNASMFLCLNNASAYKVGHTRYLHAFSLGAPVVGHADTALSMPEIEHGSNALLGHSMAEIAGLIAEAAGDRALRRRIGGAGYETFRALFTADKVAPAIGERLLAGRA